MKSRITERHPVYATDADHVFYLVLNDDDVEHVHDDFGHAFPASRGQLLTLHDQITKALKL